MNASLRTPARHRDSKFISAFDEVSLVERLNSFGMNSRAPAITPVS